MGHYPPPAMIEDCYEESCGERWETSVEAGNWLGCSAGLSWSHLPLGHVRVDLDSRPTAVAVADAVELQVSLSVAERSGNSA